MKRNKNRKNRNWRNFVVLTLVCMLAATLVGCKTSTAVTPEPSSTSEVVSESVSEPVSEEVLSEEETYEMPEIVDNMQTIYCETYEEMFPYFEKLENAAVVVLDPSYMEEGQVFLYNGAHYTIKEGFAMTVKSPEIIKNITSTSEYVFTANYVSEGIIEWDISVETTGMDIEVPLTITYDDGTEENITIYITKDWKYPWEE